VLDPNHVARIDERRRPAVLRQHPDENSCRPLLSEAGDQVENFFWETPEQRQALEQVPEVGKRLPQPVNKAFADLQAPGALEMALVKRVECRSPVRCRMRGLAGRGMRQFDQRIGRALHRRHHHGLARVGQ